MKSKTFEIHTREGVEKMTIFASQLCYWPCLRREERGEEDWCTLDWWPISVVVLFRVRSCVHASERVYDIMTDFFRVCMTLQDIIGTKTSR